MKPKFRAKSQGRYGKQHKPGVMNKTEAEYAERLQVRKTAGEIIEWWFEAITFKLAPDCRFTSDFAVLFPDGTMELVDVKNAGPINETSAVKARVAADKFFMFAFVQERKQSKKDGGGWTRKVFSDESEPAVTPDPKPAPTKPLGTISADEASALMRKYQ